MKILTVIAVLCLLAARTDGGEYSFSSEIVNLGDWQPIQSSPDGALMIVLKVHPGKSLRTFGVMRTKTWRLIGEIEGNPTGGIVFYSSNEFAATISGSLSLCRVADRIVQERIEIGSATDVMCLWGEDVMVRTIVDEMTFMCQIAIVNLATKNVVRREKMFVPDYQGRYIPLREENRVLVGSIRANVYSQDFSGNTLHLVVEDMHDDVISRFLLSPKRNVVLWGDSKGIGLFPKSLRATIKNNDEKYFFSGSESEYITGAGFVTDKVVWTCTNHTFRLHEISSRNVLCRDDFDGKLISSCVPIFGSRSMLVTFSDGRVRRSTLLTGDDELNFSPP